MGSQHKASMIRVGYAALLLMSILFTTAIIRFATA